MTEELIEKVSRAMASALGVDPDELVPATGYANAPLIPFWQKQREWAIRHLAAHYELFGRFQ